ncbi:MAG: DUF4286 family protein [Saprospiraceae bacterium]
METMVLYNVTIKIDHGVHDNWLAWMKVVHLPEMMATGCFYEYTLSRLLGTDETEGFTYSIQYLAKNFAAYQEYQEKHATELQKNHHHRYKERYVAFRSIMKVIERGEE